MTKSPSLNEFNRVNNELRNLFNLVANEPDFRELVMDAKSRGMMNLPTMNPRLKLSMLSDVTARLESLADANRAFQPWLKLAQTLGSYFGPVERAMIAVLYEPGKLRTLSELGTTKSFKLSGELLESFSLYLEERSDSSFVNFERSLGALRAYFQHPQIHQLLLSKARSGATPAEKKEFLRLRREVLKERRSSLELAVDQLSAARLLS